LKGERRKVKAKGLVLTRGDPFNSVGYRLSVFPAADSPAEGVYTAAVDGW